MGRAGGDDDDNGQLRLVPCRSERPIRDLLGNFGQIPPRNRFEIEASSTINENATIETIDKLTD